jgi:hypothetical protein
VTSRKRSERWCGNQYKGGKRILIIKNEEKYLTEESSSLFRHKEEINKNVAKLKLLNSSK